jgi:prefoldin subunit 5
VLVDCRGLESALEAVRVSVEAVRLSVEAVEISIEALRCLKGRGRLEEAPENVN